MISILVLDWITIPRSVNICSTFLGTLLTISLQLSFWRLTSWTNWKVSPINLNSQGMSLFICRQGLTKHEYKISEFNSFFHCFLPASQLAISPQFIALTCTKSADGGKFTDFCFNKSGLPFRTQPARNGEDLSVTNSILAKRFTTFCTYSHARELLSAFITRWLVANTETSTEDWGEKERC